VRKNQNYSLGNNGSFAAERIPTNEGKIYLEYKQGNPSA
jgi:hypothetical protein